MSISKVMVRYKVKPEAVDENARLVKQVFAQLAREAPSGVSYATFLLPDGQTFVHVASVEIKEGVHPLTSLAAFKEFTSDIKNRCAEPPVTTELTEVASYHAFTG